MAGIIATLLENSKNISSTITKGPGRHVYNEIVDLQNISDPDLASPYLKASGVCTIPAREGTCTSGNLTITIAFPKYGVSVTTANIAFNAQQAAIQSAVDDALDGSTIVASYNAGDVDVALTGNLDDTGNDCVITANGATVNGAYMTIATNNVNLGSANLSTPVVTTPGTMNRPAEAFLKTWGVVGPTGDVTPQGVATSAASYELLNEGDINAHSMSPALIDAVLRDVAYEEQPTGGGTESGLSALFRSMIGCV